MLLVWIPSSPPFSTPSSEVKVARSCLTLFMEFSRQEYWTGLAFTSPGDLPQPEIKPGSPAWQADSLPSEPPHLFSTHGNQQGRVLH